MKRIYGRNMEKMRKKKTSKKHDTLDFLLLDFLKKTSLFIENYKKMLR